MDETKLRAILQEVWAQAQHSILSKKIFSKRWEIQKKVISKAVNKIQALTSPKIPVYKPEELAEAIKRGNLVWTDVIPTSTNPSGKEVLDIDLKGG